MVTDAMALEEARVPASGVDTTLVAPSVSLTTVTSTTVPGGILFATMAMSTDWALSIKLFNISHLREQ